MGFYVAPMPGDARLIHELEQMEAALRDLAPVMASMRDILMENGYTREEAVDGSFRVMEVLLEEAQRDPDEEV